jgi:hypothetical protein
MSTVRLYSKASAIISTKDSQFPPKCCLRFSPDFSCFNFFSPDVKSISQTVSVQMFTNAIPLFHGLWMRAQVWMGLLDESSWSEWGCSICAVPKNGALSVFCKYLTCFLLILWQCRLVANIIGSTVTTNQRIQANMTSSIFWIGFIFI